MYTVIEDYSCCSWIFQFEYRGILKQMPLYFNKYVEKYFGKDYELLELFAFTLEIAFDEKVIAKIIAGYNLLVINVVANLRINYTNQMLNGVMTHERLEQQETIDETDND